MPSKPTRRPTGGRTSISDHSHPRRCSEPGVKGVKRRLGGKPNRANSRGQMGATA
ncbi:MAG: hypothetical protein LBJ95_02240 [Oscillospiraceae bacterium]|nr:hypothetical protein [Oscillospiraceae bacterium]